MFFGAEGHRAFSIIEIVIAMAIGVIVISGVAIAAFGNQTTTTSSALSAAASAQASLLIESARSTSRGDFNLLNPTSSVNSDFMQNLEVELQNDYVTKKVTSHIWNPLSPSVNSIFTTLITNTENADAPDTCDSRPSGDWSHPILSSVVLNSYPGVPVGGYEIGDIDVFKGHLYVAIASSSAINLPTLFIFDTSLPSPALESILDTNSLAKRGLSSLKAGTTFETAKTYLYASSISSKQLQIFDVTMPSNPSVVTSFAVRPAGEGSSIFYRDGYVYSGLTAAADVEFNVLDVRTPSTPVWKGGYAVGNTVESIVVKGPFAYLATDDTVREFELFNVESAVSPYFLTSYDAPGAGGGFGRKVTVVGTRAYLGRSWVFTTNTPEMHILDVSNTSAVPSVIAARDIGTGANPYSVYGILVRDRTLFLVTKSAAKGQLTILDLSDPLSLPSQAPMAVLDLPGNSGGVAMDCEGNTIYIGSFDGAGNSYISVVKPS